MSRNIIDYGKLVDEAMHIIVCKVLKLVEKNGLPGEHHFFISFVTKHPGVKISKTLLDKYPREMTIVLQYQYQDLEVGNVGFEVTLSFNNVKETIFIPYSAITTFADPSVQFGLQFREIDREFSDLDLEFLEEELEKLEKLENKSSKSAIQKNKTSSDKAKKKSASNVVSLDQFRKK